MSKNRPTISDYDVRVRAYRIWERTGRPEGHAEDHWREALAELEAEQAASLKAVPPQPAVSTLPTRIAVEEASRDEDKAA